MGRFLLLHKPSWWRCRRWLPMVAGPCCHHRHRPQSLALGQRTHYRCAGLSGSALPSGHPEQCRAPHPGRLGWYYPHRQWPGRGPQCRHADLHRAGGAFHHDGRKDQRRQAGGVSASVSRARWYWSAPLHFNCAPAARKASLQGYWRLPRTPPSALYGRRFQDVPPIQTATVQITAAPLFRLPPPGRGEAGPALDVAHARTRGLARRYSASRYSARRWLLAFFSIRLLAPAGIMTVFSLVAFLMPVHALWLGTLFLWTRPSAALLIGMRR